eukprot:CAMPEP_0185017846 /NCGR_PEP_ID=MMETSP1103-20130426/725_1 /TAXON_ID=36769 /ORGANISM="Paraphysomonas bandaiensis, Strain Caron Lab Isolate" /LENGTH=344 /DNA_ID=CAMNT_0027547439 /DNA_START=308 /DNA_END=1342 /DNA_ORIENTATION=+
MTSPPNSIDITDIYIVTNLMESDLERIVRSRQKLTDHHYQYFLYQILRALKYIHSANVLHRDLKPSNLLVNANCDLAVCDFGLARGFDCENETMTEYVQTRWYRAPELLCESPHYGRPVDIWGVGCIFAELLTHEACFRGDNPPHQLEVIVSKLGCPSREKLDFVESPAALQRILRYEGRTPPPFSSLFAPGCNPQAIDLLSRMLQFHPDDRISVTDAMAHPYLKDFYGQMSEPDSDYLFDFDFEKGGSISQNLSKEEVQALMYSEMLVYRPSAGSIEDIPPAVRMRLSFGSGAKQSYESDDGEAMHTARDYDDDDKMVVDDDYDSKMEYDNHSHRYGGYKGYK